MSIAYFGIPKIIWGDSLENQFIFDYPLYDWVTRSEALEGSQFLRIESGYEDSWIVNTSYVLEATVRFIEQDDWDTNWIPFLEWAREKKTFRFYSDEFDSFYYTSYLVEPITESPSIEPDGTRTIRLVIRNSAEPYEITQAQGLVPSGSYPTSSLVLFLNNSNESYPGVGTTWYDVSGNNIDFIISGSPTFNRYDGFTLNGTNQFFTTAISSSLGTYWPSGSAQTSSLTIITVVNPDTAKNAVIFGLWDSSIPTTGSDSEINAQQRYKFNLDTNPGGNPLFDPPANSIEASIYGKQSTGIWNTWYEFHDSTGIIASGSENILLWELSGSASNIYVSSSLIGSQGIDASGQWFGNDPPSTIGVGKNVFTGAYDAFFDGKIRVVMAYNRILTQQEKSDIFNYLTVALK